MFKNSLPRFLLIAFLEGCSFLLFAITMPLKYMMGLPKPNYFIGFRLPWTLESEDNWRKTHQLVGKLWVAGGLAITISTLLLPANISFIFFVIIMLTITIIPIVFSYRYFKKTQNNN